MDLSKQTTQGCFQREIAYVNLNNLLRRTTSDKVLHNKTFSSKYDGYQRGLASIVYKCFDKIPSDNAIKSEIMLNKQFGKELHKPIITKVKNEEYTHVLCVICY